MQGRNTLLFIYSKTNMLILICVTLIIFSFVLNNATWKFIMLYSVWILILSALAIVFDYSVFKDMNSLFWITSYLLWAIIWSYSSVLITRSTSNKSWITNWDSECPICRHKLSKVDLLPLFWYLKNKWKCSHCWTKIPDLYIRLELIFWLIFLFNYLLLKLLLWTDIELEIKIFLILIMWFFSYSIPFWIFLDKYIENKKKWKK